MKRLERGDSSHGVCFWLSVCLKASPGMNSGQALGRGLSLYQINIHVFPNKQNGCCIFIRRTVMVVKAM